MPAKRFNETGHQFRGDRRRAGEAGAAEAEPEGRPGPSARPHGSSNGAKGVTGGADARSAECAGYRHRGKGASRPSSTRASCWDARRRSPSRGRREPQAGRRPLLSAMARSARRGRRRRRSEATRRDARVPEVGERRRRRERSDRSHGGGKAGSCCLHLRQGSSPRTREDRVSGLRGAGRGEAAPRRNRAPATGPKDRAGAPNFPHKGRADDIEGPSSTNGRMDDGCTLPIGSRVDQTVPQAKAHWRRRMR